MNKELLAAGPASNTWSATKVDLYRSLHRTLPLTDLKHKIVMRGPMNHITSALLDAQFHTVLDIGCGTGLLARKLAAHKLRVTGIDASRTMIRRARLVAPGVELQWGDATTMKQDCIYDAAVISMALHEMSAANRIRTWRNTINVVRNGGLVFVLDFVPPTGASLYARLLSTHIERGERSFDRINPDHYTNYRQFMAAGGLSMWLRDVNAEIFSESYYLGGNLALCAVCV